MYILCLVFRCSVCVCVRCFVCIMYGQSVCLGVYLVSVYVWEIKVGRKKRSS